MRELLHSVALRAARYLEDIQERRVSPSAEAVGALARFHEPLPDGPTAPEDVIRMLDEVGSPATMGVAGPRFFGFVLGGSLPAALGANWLASAWDQNAGLFLATPISATLEEVSLRWLLDALALTADSGGAFVTGATMANFTALAAARHAVLGRVGWDVEAQGLFGAPAIQVVVGEAAHPSVIKSLRLLGMRRERGVDTGAALKSLGGSGLGELIDRNCRCATRFAAGLAGAGFEILNDVVLNQVLVSFGTPEMTGRAIAGLQEDGTCWCGPTLWQGRVAMRISVSSWATTEADVERSLEAMLRIAREAAGA